MLEKNRFNFLVQGHVTISEVKAIKSVMLFSVSVKGICDFRHSAFFLCFCFFPSTRLVFLYDYKKICMFYMITHRHFVTDNAKILAILQDNI